MHWVDRRTDAQTDRRTDAQTNRSFTGKFDDYRPLREQRGLKLMFQ